MGGVLLRAFAIWAGFFVLAILNAAVREKLLAPLLGPRWALPLSGVLLSVLIFLAAYILLPFLGGSTGFHYWVVGGMWLVLTVSFEFVFGRYVRGAAWGELLASYNVLTGNLWLLVVVTTFFAPYAAAKLRGLV